jgi:hypothetical protein
MSKINSVFVIVGVLAVSCRAQSPTSSQPPLFTPAPGSPFAVGSRPVDIATGEVNGDGKLDIITANVGSHNLTVLLGNGKGDFKAAPGSPLAVDVALHLVALGDFNQDGNLDLALTDHDSYDVRVLLGDGRGNFTPAPGSPFSILNETRPHNHGLAIGDVNHDGNPDIVTSNHGHHSASVLLGNGKGEFRPAPNSPFNLGRRGYKVVIADVDGDMKKDLVISNVAGKSVTVLLNDGSGGFTPAPGSPFTAGSEPNSLAIGDVNGDGKLDIVTANLSSNDVTLLLGQ